MIYLDNNATTRVDDGVVDAMLPYFTERYANAASIHQFADEAREAIRQSRTAVGRLLGCRGDDLVFTSGATEALNTAIQGAARRSKNTERRKIIVTSVEHAAVLEPVRVATGRHALELVVAPVQPDGSLELEPLLDAIDETTLLVAVMLANNETGVIYPVQAVAERCRTVGALSLCDATQAVGKIEVKVGALGVDLLAASAHKFHGPKGVGALYVRRGVDLAPLLHGGGQQRGRRAGTENVSGVVGFGMAAYRAAAELAEGTYDGVAARRDAFASSVAAAIPDAIVVGDGQPRLPTTVNLAFAHASGEAMLQQLDALGIVASSSSACQSNETEPSHVLRAMGVPTEYIHGSIRFGLSRYTTTEELDEVVARLPRIVERGREASTAR